MNAAMTGDPLDFSGRSVLVAGGSSGIGNGIAQSFRTRGAAVTVWGTRATAADYAGEEGSDLTGLNYRRVDVLDEQAVAEAAKSFGDLDVLILSQGAVIYRRGEFEMKGFSHVVGMNLNSLMACSLAFHDKLAAAGGSVIVISSTGAFRSTMGNPAYSASKAGTLGLVRSLAEAWARDGIRVNAIAPGLVETRMTKVTTSHPDRLAAMLDEIPLRRLGTPADVAGAVLFLASPLASYIIGQMIVVDGGSLLS